ncbi:LuxR family transcriptional regulator [Mycobacterium antarcticum]|uniref:cupin domain-containing protein n=1 Tax=unclassified Mycolicibacterium TaxID=2636767 RepID=UPI002397E637|nr:MULTISPECIES: cupin domain-containing protein [unclassified Mycolicibacterium]BDX31914.1 LuxR family transcriptional regulator [Mycolicibacterium sp. TUM20985]GLP75215.1 LuxR family transcriptional regulator [Mycolicibacterium sp. TUM20983]
MAKNALISLARAQLTAAHDSGSGRSAHTLYGGPHHALRQTLMALTAGSRLSDHESPGEATLQVLQGHVRLTSSNARCDGIAGDHLVIPPSRHGLDAIEDSVVLLTVVKSVQPPQS